MSSMSFLFVFVVIIAVLFIAINFIFAPHVPYQEKDSPFECGFHSFSQSRLAFNIGFFIFGILFLLFDLEILAIYPFSISSNTNEEYGTCVVLAFIGLVTFGFVYEFGKGALEIDSESIKSKSNDSMLFVLEIKFNVINFFNQIGARRSFSTTYWLLSPDKDNDRRDVDKVMNNPESPKDVDMVDIDDLNRIKNQETINPESPKNEDVEMKDADSNDNNGQGNSNPESPKNEDVEMRDADSDANNYQGNNNPESPKNEDVEMKDADSDANNYQGNNNPESPENEDVEMKDADSDDNNYQGTRNPESPKNEDVEMRDADSDYNNGQGTRNPESPDRMDIDWEEGKSGQDTRNPELPKNEDVDMDANPYNNNNGEGSSNSEDRNKNEDVDMDANPYNNNNGEGPSNWTGNGNGEGPSNQEDSNNTEGTRNPEDNKNGGDPMDLDRRIDESVNGYYNTSVPPFNELDRSELDRIIAKTSDESMTNYANFISKHNEAGMQAAAVYREDCINKVAESIISANPGCSEEEVLSKVKESATRVFEGNEYQNGPVLPGQSQWYTSLLDESLENADIASENADSGFSPSITSGIEFQDQNVVGSIRGGSDNNGNLEGEGPGAGGTEGEGPVAGGSSNGKGGSEGEGPVAGGSSNGKGGSEGEGPVAGGSANGNGGSEGEGPVAGGSDDGNGSNRDIDEGEGPGARGIEGEGPDDWEGDIDEDTPFNIFRLISENFNDIYSEISTYTFEYDGGYFSSIFLGLKLIYQSFDILKLWYYLYIQFIILKIKIILFF
nr:NADH dehydrogenase subunit 3 [Ophiostoma piliferum]